MRNHEVYLTAYTQMRRRHRDVEVARAFLQPVGAQRPPPLARFGAILGADAGLHFVGGGAHAGQTVVIVGDAGAVGVLLEVDHLQQPRGVFRRGPVRGDRMVGHG